MVILNDGHDRKSWPSQLRRHRLVLGLAAALLIIALTTLNNKQRSPTAPDAAEPNAGWKDHKSIQQFTRPASSNLAPQHLAHLTNSAPAPFNELYAVSAWLDPRPTLTGAKRDIVILATIEGRPWFRQENARRMPDNNQLLCYTTVRGRGKGKAVYATSRSVVQPQDGDAHDTERPWIYAQFICELDIDDSEVGGDWESAEIFVTLAQPNTDPPNTAFLAVTPLTLPPIKAHRQGKGVSTMCLPPLSGDFYAPFLADYFAHYRALGISLFFPYLLNPGPETLKVLRELMEKEPGIKPVRWGMPKGWIVEGAAGAGRGFAVEPELWDLPGLENLPWDVELGLVVPQAETDVKLWYYGQSPATQDCAFRSMAAGGRWLLGADYDEWLLLRLPNGKIWPPNSALKRLRSPNAPNELLTTFAKSVRPQETDPLYSVHRLPEAGVKEVVPGMVEQGRLASGYMFRSAFFCMTCRPTSGPRADSAGRKAVEKVLLKGLDWTKPGMEVPFAYSSPVRHSEWFWEGIRSKQLVDPWAWRFLGIHDAKTSYVEWAIIAGACATGGFNAAPHRLKLNDYDPECARKYVEHFGAVTYVVDPGEHASNGQLALDAVDYSRGGLMHIRVAPALRETLVAHEQQFGMNGLGKGRKEGKDLVERARVGPAIGEWESQYDPLEFGTGEGRGAYPRLELVEDWSFVDVMGGVLAARLRERQRESLGEFKPSEWTWVGWVAMVAVGVWAYRRVLAATKQGSAQY